MYRKMSGLEGVGLVGLRGATLLYCRGSQCDKTSVIRYSMDVLLQMLADARRKITSNFAMTYKFLK